jgi:LDH2 family malate/lactate/ureidoglycolate dehydrogenase
MIAPWGGLDRRVGLNPISWAAPTGLGFSYNLDMAPSIVAGSKIEMARDRGEAIPADWGYDADGNPTTNPSDIMPGGGTLAGVGGYKGVGLGVGADILCSILPGGRYHEGQDPTVGGGMIVQAIDIEHFQPLAEFTGRMDRMVAYYKSGRKRPGVDDVYLPGELESGRAHARVSAGIPLDQPTRASLRSAAEDAGIGYTIELPSHS